MSEVVSTLKRGAVCLCAEWCGTCRSYREGVFADISRQYPDIPFIWMDIEEHASLCDPLELESFPNWLIIWDGLPRFFGTLLPHYGHIDRLLQQITQGGALELSVSPDMQCLVDYINQQLFVK